MGWPVYPKKTDKRLALKSFVKALKRETLEPILDGAKRYRDDPNRDDSFTKNPSTWLNADAWENGPEPVRGRKLTNAENAALLAQKYRGQEQVKAIESPDVDFGGMLKGVN
jgi:ABC-type oligopeptide transport system substrate-binding subunit